MMTNDLFQPQSFAGKGMEHGFMVYPDNTTSDIITGSNDRLTFRFSRELQYTFHTHPKEYSNQSGEIGSFRPSPEDKLMVEQVKPDNIHLLVGYERKPLSNGTNTIAAQEKYELRSIISFYNQNGVMVSFPFERFIKNMSKIWEMK